MHYTKTNNGKGRAMRLSRLREWREYRALTQKELSDLTGVSRDGISNYENGEREARPSTARRLAKALDVTVGDLVSPPTGIHPSLNLTTADPHIVRDAVDRAFARADDKLERLPASVLLDLRDRLSEDLVEKAPNAIYLRAAMSNYLDQMVMDRIETTHAQETLFTETDEMKARKVDHTKTLIEGLMAGAIRTSTVVGGVA
jgi:transcriptional regulator with XRE-family HTH domain